MRLGLNSRIKDELANISTRIKNYAKIIHFLHLISGVVVVIVVSVGLEETTSLLVCQKLVGEVHLMQPVQLLDCCGALL